jgi:hypothetical protein
MKAACKELSCGLRQAIIHYRKRFEEICENSNPYVLEMTPIFTFKINFKMICKRVYEPSASL